jgi:hypothetical protein
METSLSTYEMQLVTDAALLLTKNKIINKVFSIFGDLSEEYKRSISEYNINVINLVNAKISKGENYQGLPYVMLDYPRQFSKNAVFAIRSFFWWGNFFSITLHLSGSYLQQYKDQINKSLEQFYNEGWQINTRDEQWEHHFGDDNYKAIEPQVTNIDEQTFIKLAKKIPLQEWDSVNKFYTESFRWLLRVIST